jgi:hypothetical protein
MRAGGSEEPNHIPLPRRVAAPHGSLPTSRRYPYGDPGKVIAFAMACCCHAALSYRTSMSSRALIRRPRTYDAGVCRRHRRAVLMCLNAPSSSLPSINSAR